MIIRCLFTALCLGLFLAIVPASASEISLSEVTRALETPFQEKTAENLRIYDYSADFTQESLIASLDRLQYANGHIDVAFNYRSGLSAPEVKFRWQYEQPTTQEIVSDGKTLWVYLPENNQVIQSDLESVNQSRQNDPMTFLTGLGNLSRDFRVSWAKPQNDIDGNYILELRPQRVSSLINRLIIVVDRFAVQAFQNSRQVEGGPQNPIMKTQVPLGQSQTSAGSHPDTIRFPMLSTTVYDPNDNSTVINFTNLRVNHGISSKIFNFILPEGVEVVRPSGKDVGN